MTRSACVVFDVDDTLYLERDYVRSGFVAVGRWASVELGIEDFFELAWKLFEDGTRGRVFNAVLEELGRSVEADAIAAMVRVYRTHLPEIRLLEDARKCLDRLHRRAPMAGITDGPLESQRAKIDALGLAAWLDPVVCTAALGEQFGKPHPRAFEMIQEIHSAERYTYVGDNPEKDFRAPRELGWRTVRLCRPAALRYDLPSAVDVDHEIDSLDELDALLGLGQ